MRSNSTKVVEGHNDAISSSAYYEVVKELGIAAAGTVRVYFDLWGEGFGVIYKNGSQVGTERTSSSTLTGYSEDFSVAVGDVIQVALKSVYQGNLVGWSYVHNNSFELRINTQPGFLAFVGNP